MQSLPVPRTQMAAFLHQLHWELEPSSRKEWVANLVEHVESSQSRWLGRIGFENGEARCGAYCTEYPGNLGVLTGPISFPNGSLDQSELLLKSLLHDSISAPLGLIQCVVDEDSNLASHLQRAGMRRLTNLVHMDCWLTHSQLEGLQSEQPSGNARWVPFQQSDSHRWIQFLEATYVQTLDCPELNGLRKTEDTLAGYFQSAKSFEREWWMLQVGHLDVGCILLTEHASRIWELTYMGVHPDARGQRLGAKLLAKGCSQVIAKGGEILNLSADERNVPALRLYETFGFQSTNRSTAWFYVPSLQTEQPVEGCL